MKNKSLELVYNQIRELPVTSLQQVSEFVQTELKSRNKELEITQQLEELALSHGTSLAKLGFTQTVEPKKNKPTRPYLKSFDQKAQRFYKESGELKLVRSTSHSRELLGAEVDILKYEDLGHDEKMYANALIEDKRLAAISEFNARAIAWNEYATENGLKTVKLS